MSKTVHICEWQAFPLSNTDLPDLGNKYLLDLERRINLKSYLPLENPESIAAADWPLLFAERFEQELLSLLSGNPQALVSDIFTCRANDITESPFAKLNTELNDREILYNLLNAIFSIPFLEDEIPALLGRGSLSIELRDKIRFDKSIHVRWKAIVDIAQNLLNAYRTWIISSFSIDTDVILEKQSESVIVNSAEGAGQWIGLIQRFNQAVEATLKTQTLSRLVKYESISLPFDCPPATLMRHPEYDYRDLYLTITSEVSELLRRANFGDIVWSEYLQDTIVLRDWNLSSDSDIRELQVVFDRFRNLFQPPPNFTGYRQLDIKICNFLDKKQFASVQGLSKLWRKVGMQFLAIRPVEFSNDGIVMRSSCQVTIVLGLAHSNYLPSDTSTQVSQSGALSLQREGNLWLACMMCDFEELQTIDFSALLELGEEISCQMHSEEVLEVASEGGLENCLEYLSVLLEMDIGLMHRRLKVSRLSKEAAGFISNGRITAIDNLLLSLSDEEERADLESAIIVMLFNFDSEEALKRLKSLDQGEKRHDTISRVLQVADDGEELEIIRQINDMWLQEDAYYNPYKGDAYSLLMIFSSSLGNLILQDRYVNEMAISVRADWLRLIMRKSPKARADQIWLRRISNLISDSGGLVGLSLEQLADLNEIMQKYKLPGRSYIINAALPVIRGSVYAEYWSQRFGVHLSENANKIT
jgi:hypothetical protein